MKPLPEFLVSLLLLLISTISSSAPPTLTERERIGMDFRLQALSPSNGEIEPGWGYGLHILFVMPGRFQGDLGVDFFSSSQDPLVQIYVPGWKFREAHSKIDLIPVSIGGTFALGSGRLVPYLGLGAGWWILNEHIEAVFVDTGWIYTTRRSFVGKGPGGHLCAGVRYLITPRASVFSELKYVTAWIDYEGEELTVRGPAFSAGIRF
jgi:hypothetical protein